MKRRDKNKHNIKYCTVADNVNDKVEDRDLLFLRISDDVLKLIQSIWQITLVAHNRLHVYLVYKYQESGYKYKYTLWWWAWFFPSFSSSGCDLMRFDKYAKRDGIGDIRHLAFRSLQSLSLYRVHNIFYHNLSIYAIILNYHNFLSNLILFHHR